MPAHQEPQVQVFAVVDPGLHAARVVRCAMIVGKIISATVFVTAEVYIDTVDVPSAFLGLLIITFQLNWAIPVGLWITCARIVELGSGRWKNYRVVLKVACICHGSLKSAMSFVY
jgi:hypothetical protein